MGVLGLWQLLSPVGQPVTLESLENKILAVDVSIWLNQAIKGYRDAKGGAVANAHLLSLFSRLCKLLYYKIRPIIVFDGGVPELKRQTVVNRRKTRAAMKTISRETALKMMASYLASKQVNKNAKSPVKKAVLSKIAAKDDIFALPPLENPKKSYDEDPGVSGRFEIRYDHLTREDIKYLESIDIESKEFQELPAQVKQEILCTLQDIRKRRNWDYYEDLPKESNEFSSYQMQNLLKRRQLQNKLEEVHKDVNKTFCTDIISLYSDSLIGEPSKIMSDETSHYVLLKKKASNSKEQSENSSPVSQEDGGGKAKPSVSSSSPSKSSTTDRMHESVEDATDSGIDEDKDVKGDTLSSTEQIGHCEPAQSVNANTKTTVSTSTATFTETTEPSSPKILCSDDSQITKTEGSGSYISAENDVEMIDRNWSNQETSSTVGDKTSDDDLIVARSSMTEELAEPNFVDLEPEKVLCDLAPKTAESENPKHFESVQEITETIEDEISVITDLAGCSSQSETNRSALSWNRTLDGFKSLASTSKSDDIVDNSGSSYDTLEGEISAISAAVLKEMEAESSVLQTEQAKKDRQASTVQEHMYEECQELLRHFGVPYVVSSMEAEAQCAFFDAEGVTDGTVTDDSDVWLFGGRRVYKNFFNHDKFVEFYKDKEIESHFGLNRTKLIAFALLTGSDYTDGIENVGPVTATEIISEFRGEGFDILEKFKEWWTAANKHSSPPKNKVRAKFQKLPIPESFPNRAVFDAYLNPAVDSSLETFTWGLPDLDALRDYTKEKFGWNKTKVDAVLLPVIKKLNERTKQMHLDSYFTISLKKQQNLFPSKRIMSALEKINAVRSSGDASDEETCDNPKKLCARKKQASDTSSKRQTRSKKKLRSTPQRRAEIKKVLDLSEESSDDS